MPQTPRTPAQLRTSIRTCWIYLVLSTLVVGYLGYGYVRQRQFIARAIQVQGKIAGNLRVVSRKHGDHFVAIFTFQDKTGKTWEVTDRKSNYTFQRAVFNQPCNVLYDPDNPADAQLGTPDAYLDRTGYLAIPGLVVLVVGAIAFFSLRQNYATLRRLRAAEGDGTTPRDPAILEGP